MRERMEPIYFILGFFGYVSIGIILYFLTLLIDRIFKFNLFITKNKGYEDKNSLGLFIVSLWPIMIPFLVLAGIVTFVDWFFSLFFKDRYYSSHTKPISDIFDLSKLHPHNKKSCLKCSRITENYDEMLRYYYLGRPCNCIPAMFDKEHNPEGYTPESYARQCNKYTTEKIFEEDYGSIKHWLRQSDGEIVPWDKTYIRHIWFERGFYAAIKALGGIPLSFEKKCSNCEHSNKHIVNRCEKTEVCERWAIDRIRAFDNRFYGNLCDDCIVEHCDKRRGIWSDFPMTRCKDWQKPTDEEKEGKELK
jgi:hypothetical protein